MAEHGALKGLRKGKSPDALLRTLLMHLASGHSLREDGKLALMGTPAPRMSHPRHTLGEVLGQGRALEIASSVPHHCQLSMSHALVVSVACSSAE